MKQPPRVICFSYLLNLLLVKFQGCIRNIYATITPPTKLSDSFQQTKFQTAFSSSSSEMLHESRRPKDFWQNVVIGHEACPLFIEDEKDGQIALKFTLHPCKINMLNLKITCLKRKIIWTKPSWLWVQIFSFKGAILIARFFETKKIGIPSDEIFISSPFSFEWKKN